MTPPPAELFASRVLLGPALRAQPDRRLVGLVRDGYESAFEEIVRRYRRPLDRFAASLVGPRSEDVTQDAFSKALQALRGSEAEIELRPWLYRIVRNTALNDLRDRPPSAEELAETLSGGAGADFVAERREELARLIKGLQALPEPQRAAIVMRELEGLGHEEIAAALGVSGGAARQAIHRARTALRDGLGMLVPLPLLRTLFDHGVGSAGGAAGAGAASAGAASAGIGGVGAGAAVKLGLATVLVAGSVGAGVAIDHGRDQEVGPESAAAATPQRPHGDGGARSAPSAASGPRSADRTRGGRREAAGGGGGGDSGGRSSGTRLAAGDPSGGGLSTGRGPVRHTTPDGGGGEHTGRGGPDPGGRHEEGIDSHGGGGPSSVGGGEDGISLDAGGGDDGGGSGGPGGGGGDDGSVSGGDEASTTTEPVATTEPAPLPPSPEEAGGGEDGSLGSGSGTSGDGISDGGTSGDS